MLIVGANPYHKAYERDVKIIGAAGHCITSELDAGPIIEQDIVRITPRDDVDDLIRKGKDLERIVLARGSAPFSKSGVDLWQQNGSV